MKGSGSAAFAAASILIAGPASAHEDMKGMEMPMKQMEKAPGTSALKPAEGASVKIVSPKPGQVVKDDRVPLEFRWAKGKRGHHSHVYVDGKLRSMFEGSRATLTGMTDFFGRSDASRTSVFMRTSLRRRLTRSFPVSK